MFVEEMIFFMLFMGIWTKVRPYERDTRKRTGAASNWKRPRPWFSV